MNDMTDDIRSDFQSTLPGHFRFELASLIGRWFLQKKAPRLPSEPQLLNLGCGDRAYPDFINADFFRIRSEHRPKNFWMVDLRYPLPCEAGHWDGIFTEHTLEHLYPSQALALLREAYRTLKPGGWLRVVVPDLGRYVQYYNGQSPDPLFERWPLRAEALRNLSQRHFHLSLWDAALLDHYLRRAGFTQTAERQAGQGADARLLKDSANRQWESLYMEARK